MPITKLVPPSPSPLTTADYDAQNGLTDARLVYESFPVVGSNVVKGSRFLIFGSTFIASSTTAITGTPSPYILLTDSGSTAIPSFIPNLTGVTWSNIYNGYYDVSNNLVIFDEWEAFRIGAIGAPHRYLENIISKITNQILLKVSDVNFQNMALSGSITDVEDITGTGSIDMIGSVDAGAVNTGQGYNNVVPEDVYYSKTDVAIDQILPSILITQTAHISFQTSAGGIDFRLPAIGTYSFSFVASGDFIGSENSVPANYNVAQLGIGEHIIITYRRIS